MNLTRIAEVVYSNQTRFDSVIEADTMAEFLMFCKDLILARMMSHAGTNNSLVVEKIQKVGLVIDQLLFHLSKGQNGLFPFLYVLTVFLEEDYSVGQCVVKNGVEDATNFKSYRDMVVEIWRRFLMKVSVLLRALCESKKAETGVQVFSKLSSKLDVQSVNTE